MLLLLSSCCGLPGKSAHDRKPDMQDELRLAHGSVGNGCLQDSYMGLDGRRDTPHNAAHTEMGLQQPVAPSR